MGTSLHPGLPTLSRGHFRARRGHGGPRRARPRARASRVASSSPRRHRARHRRRPRLRRVAVGSGRWTVSSLKRELLAAVSASRKPAPTPARRRHPRRRRCAGGAARRRPSRTLRPMACYSTATIRAPQRSARSRTSSTIPHSARHRSAVPHLLRLRTARGLGGDERARRGERPGGRPRRGKVDSVVGVGLRSRSNPRCGSSDVSALDGEAREVTVTFTGGVDPGRRARGEARDLSHRVCVCLYRGRGGGGHVLRRNSAYIARRERGVFITSRLPDA